MKKKVCHPVKCSLLTKKTAPCTHENAHRQDAPISPRCNTGGTTRTDLPPFSCTSSVRRKRASVMCARVLIPTGRRKHHGKFAILSGKSVYLLWEPSAGFVITRRGIAVVMMRALVGTGLVTPVVPAVVMVVMVGRTGTVMVAVAVVMTAHGQHDDGCRRQDRYDFHIHIPVW